MHGSLHSVDDVMTRTVVTVRRDTPFKDIAALIEERNISALPVVDGEGRVVGVVSEADLLLKEEFRNSDPDRFTQLSRMSDLAKAGALTAQDLMTAPAVTVHDGATLSQAARIMARRKVKRLPVIDSTGSLVGVVSRADLLKVFLRDDESLTEDVRHEVVDRLFPLCADHIQVEVSDGVVTLTGWIDGGALVPVADRLSRAIEGVVDVRCHLTDGTVRSASI
ncbi:CBS domain-containing protein [Streptomyces sp. NPDC005209]|uniref:CBS domain-containing protein n=1 Tax=Streptomyces sp. NPDC005209 TaxID=3156715 RepID=UPI0033B1DF4A